MKNTGRYEQAATNLFAPEGLKQPSDAMILDAAHQVDNLIFTIGEDALRLARNLTKFADEVNQVNYDLTAPTMHSAASDITENNGRLRAKREGLFALIGAVHGPEALKAYRRSLG
jgi:ribosomal protein L10